METNHHSHHFSQTKVTHTHISYKKFRFGPKKEKKRRKGDIFVDKMRKKIRHTKIKISES